MTAPFQGRYIQRKSEKKGPFHTGQGKLKNVRESQEN